MNINVSASKGVYDAFDLSDGRVGAALDPIPTFMTMRLDQALLRPAAAPLAGKGTVQYRRALAAVGVSRAVGVRRSSRARPGQRDGSAGAPGDRRVLLRDERPGLGQRSAPRPRRFDRAMRCRSS